VRFQMLTIERVASPVAHRWWDFGADAYVVRHITDFSSFLSENLSDFRSFVEFQQIRSVDTQCPIADGTYSWRQVSSLISAFHRDGSGAVYLSPPQISLSSSNSKCVASLHPIFIAFHRVGRYPEVTHAFTEMALPCG
jgi:hypothetical protein